jgi:hypothetical protein
LLLLSFTVRDPGAPVGPLVNIQYIKSKPLYEVGILVHHPRDELRCGYKIHTLRSKVFSPVNHSSHDFSTVGARFLLLLKEEIDHDIQFSGY